MKIMKSMLGASLGVLSSLRFGTPDYTPPAHLYQRMKPITTKNIGRRYIKGYSAYMPHQGAKECARRVRQGLHLSL